MKLSTNSISAKLYRWFYYTDIMPSNLCPYFWKLVIMYLTIIPYFLVSLPVQVITKFRKKEISETIGYTFFFYVLIFFLIVFISLPVVLLSNGYPNPFWETIFPASVVIWTALLVFGVYVGIKYLKDQYEESKKMYDEFGGVYYGVDEFNRKIYVRPSKPNILVEFIKAKYNKYCPKINWYR